MEQTTDSYLWKRIRATWEKFIWIIAEFHIKIVAKKNKQKTMSLKCP